MKSDKCRYSRWEILLLSVGLIAAGFFCAGFYFPDPFAARSMGRVAFTAIFWGTRIGIPLAVIGLLLLYHGVKTGRIAPANLLLAGISTVVCLMIAYPAASFFYYRSTAVGDKLAEYHPYLQLAPRDLDMAGASGDGAITIVCLGGSTTEFRDSRGRGWPERVEERLRLRYPSRKIHVYNAGRQWYTTLHMLIHYQTNLRQHQPDILVVMEAINDLLHNADFSYLSFQPFRDDYGHFFGPMKRVMTRKTFEENLYAKFRSFWYHHPRQPVRQRQFPGIAAYQRNLNNLLDLAQRDNTDVVLMTQPNLFKQRMDPRETAALEMVHFEAIGADRQWDVESARLGMGMYNQALRAVSGNRRTGLIDLESSIPKTLEYFSDDVHYRDAAFDLVANAVAGGLERSGIIERRISANGKKRE